MTSLPASDLKTYLSAAKAAALEGGRVLTEHWGNLHHIRTKTNFSDLVTEADTGSEKAVVEALAAAFPEHSIVAEEAGLYSEDYGDFVWAIDPLDGTTNYTHQYPMVCVSVGLLYKKRPVVGVIYNPILDEMFCGAQGLGATFNELELNISQTETLQESLLVTGFAYDRQRNKNNNYIEFCTLSTRSHGVRRSGSAALDLAYLAAGRVDGYWERGLKIWDIAAGSILVTEAGGMVSDYEGNPLSFLANPGENIRILASNGHIHQELMDTLRDAREHGNPIIC